MALPCEEGEVELWGLCYSIENTTILSNLSNTSGEIPQELCALVNLEVLNLIVMFGNTNFLIGEIPDCICNLHKLTYLDFGWNTLSGEIPDSIGNLENLWYLWIFNNNLTYLPETICNLSINWDSDDYGFLPYFGAGGNQLCSDIPECIENSENLNASIDPLYYSFLITVEQDCEESCIASDVNNDGVINILDIIMVVNIIIGEIIPSDQETCSADSNSDGIINVIDIIAIVNTIISDN